MLEMIVEALVFSYYCVVVCFVIPFCLIAALVCGFWLIDKLA